MSSLRPGPGSTHAAYATGTNASRYTSVLVCHRTSPHRPRRGQQGWVPTSETRHGFRRSWHESFLTRRSIAGHGQVPDPSILLDRCSSNSWDIFRSEPLNRRSRMIDNVSMGTPADEGVLPFCLEGSCHDADPPVVPALFEAVLALRGVSAALRTCSHPSPPLRRAGQAEPTPRPGNLLKAIPPGYFLHAYDDCGVADRQPHMLLQDSYLWTFQTSDTDAEIEARSAVFSYKAVRLRYEDLDPELSYVLALTYASDHVYHRVQSLWANGVELHGPLRVPNARSIRVIVKLPAGVTRDGKLSLELRIHGEVNATLSIAELWANARSKGNTLHLEGVSGLIGDLEGQVLDLAYKPAPGVTVRAFKGKLEQSAGNGSHWVKRLLQDRPRRFDLASSEGLRLEAENGGHRLTREVPARDLQFPPCALSPDPLIRGRSSARRARSVAGWYLAHRSGRWTFRPGQAALRKRLERRARSRTVAAAGVRSAQRSHGGRGEGVLGAGLVGRPVGHPLLRRDPCRYAHYFLNGQFLGESENLFTPVQWEITGLCHPGGHDRLDLEMKVDTLSEKLSYSSDYAFHNLGGIDRSVRVVALPDVHLRTLQVRPALDLSSLRGTVTVQTTVKNTRSKAVKEMSLRLSLLTPGNPAAPPLARSQLELGSLAPGESPASLALSINHPHPWSAEKPELYRLVLELLEGDETLEAPSSGRWAFARSKCAGARFCSMACRSSWPAPAGTRSIRSPAAPTP